MYTDTPIYSNKRKGKYEYWNSESKMNISKKNYWDVMIWCLYVCILWICLFTSLTSPYLETNNRVYQKACLDLYGLVIRDFCLEQITPLWENECTKNLVVFHSPEIKYTEMFILCVFIIFTVYRTNICILYVYPFPSFFAGTQIIVFANISFQIPSTSSLNMKFDHFLFWIQCSFSNHYVGKLRFP